MKLALEIGIGIVLGNLGMEGIHLLELRYAAQAIADAPHQSNYTPSTTIMRLPQIPNSPTQTRPTDKPAYIINEQTGRRVDLHAKPDTSK